MGIPAVRAIPLNHYLNEVPEKVASGLRCKALALNVLEKICWVAFVAIMATIFTVSYTGIALTGHLPLVLAGMAIFTPVLGMGASQLNVMASRYAKNAALEEGVANELRIIADWKTPQIEQFIREKGLHLDLLPIDEIRQKNGQEPLCALLPLIARFNFLHRLQMDTEKASKDKLTYKIEADLAEKEAALGRPIEEGEKRMIRLENRRYAYRQHEHEAIPRGLDAAVVLHIIQTPTLELALTDFGDFRAKAYDERKFDRDFDPKNDDYFVFKQDVRRPPLTLAELENLEPPALRLKLFPRAIRA